MSVLHTCASSPTLCALPENLVQKVLYMAHGPVVNSHDVSLRGRERHSKRLRGETIDKAIMFDNPELVARRIRQANLGDSVPKVASKQGRAVRFQQPLQDDTSPEALAEEEALPDAAGLVDEEDRPPAETPHNAVTHPTLLPDSAGSGLNLTLSNSAAQRGSSGLLDEEGTQAERRIRHHGRVAPDLPASSHAVPGPPVLHPPGVHPPDTTGKLLVKSKTSLEVAQSVAQGILGSACDAAALGADALPAKNTGALGAKTAISSPVVSGAQKLPALPSQQPDLSQAFDGSPLPPELAREANPASNILASTTRPNVPSKVSGNVAQLKSAPVSALRLAHAGHTPHPLKSRMIQADPAPVASPQGSVGVVGGARGVSKDSEGATPAATLRFFEGASPYPSMVNKFANPSLSSMPTEDTPMVDSEAVQHQIAPDSCMGQVSSETSSVTKPRRHCYWHLHIVKLPSPTLTLLAACST